MPPDRLILCPSWTYNQIRRSGIQQGSTAMDMARYCATAVSDRRRRSTESILLSSVNMCLPNCCWTAAELPASSVCAEILCNSNVSDDGESIQSIIKASANMIQCAVAQKRVTAHLFGLLMGGGCICADL